MHDLKKPRSILSRFVLLLAALQILNQSIDLDYIAFVNNASAGLAACDDIDSFAELLLEKCIGDDSYTVESPDGDGSAQNKAIEKFNPGPIYLEQQLIVQISSGYRHNASWCSGIDINNRICKGYFNIYLPPPKA